MLPEVKYASINSFTFKHWIHITVRLVTLENKFSCLRRRIFLTNFSHPEIASCPGKIWKLVRQTMNRQTKVEKVLAEWIVLIDQIIHQIDC